MIEPNYRSDYLSKSLVAYIGNKRSLLPFLGSTFARCASQIDGRNGEVPLRFLDPFAGSGGVSRLARAMGFRVFSNDLEYYAALIGRSRLMVDPDTLEDAFAGEGGSEAAFSAVTAFASGSSAKSAAEILHPGSARDSWLRAFQAAEQAAPYIARHYAPLDTATADWRRERLFYTAENGRWLDRARNAVEFRYPFDALDFAAAPTRQDADAKAAFVESILYKAATHTNTSGVFKACHRGFGGHGGDALSRITAEMSIERPELVFAPPSEVSRLDSADFCTPRSAEIAYLDPPYNQHQYGSNYHMLTSIARWDKPPVSEERAADGFLLDRSGIRSDWIATRSDFCRKRLALPAFSRLLDAIDARFILVSYSDGGIIPLDALADLLAKHGKLKVESIPYLAYRGGKQSADRIERTSEFLFVIDRDGKVKGDSLSSRKVSAALTRATTFGRLDALLRGRFYPDRLLDAFDPREHSWVLLVTADGRLEASEVLSSLRVDSAPEEFLARLESCACASNTESFDLVASTIEQSLEALSGGTRDTIRFFTRCALDAIGFLRKLAFRKYRSEYKSRSEQLRAALTRAKIITADIGPEIGALDKLLADLNALDLRVETRASS